MTLLQLEDFGTMQYLPVHGTHSYSVEETVPKQDYLQENMKLKHQI